MPIIDRSTDSFHRLFRLLQLLPRAPRWIDTGTLGDMLHAHGFTNVRRTLQRDLIKLERMGFGIQCVQGTKPYRWRLSDGTDLPVTPSMFDQGRGARAVDLRLYADPSAVELLTAEPLSSRQRVLKDGAGSSDALGLLVEARVVLDGRLRSRLLALGPCVEVVAPDVLRAELAEAHRAAWERYARRRAPARVGA